MRTFLIAALFSAGAFASSEDRSVPAFSAVAVSSGMRATIEIGPQKPVHIEADAETLALLETTVEDGTLKIGFARNHWMHGDHSVKITIQTPRLESVAASGGSIVRATFTRANESAIQASGGSEVTAKGVDAGTLNVQGSGGSVLHVAGGSDALDLQLSGGSQLHGRDFSTRDASIQGSGGSEAELKATGKITGSLSGGSQLHAIGGARTRVATSGGSQVSAD
jgi:hypothetical protein